MTKEKIFLDISWQSIAKLALLVIIFWLIYNLKTIISWFIFALIFSMIFDPIIAFFQKKLPRTISVIIVYALLILIIVLFIYFFATKVSNEFPKMSAIFFHYLEKIKIFFPLIRREFFRIEETIQNIEEWFLLLSRNIVSAIFSLFGGIFSAITIFFLALFLSLEENFLEKIVEGLFPREKKEKFLQAFTISRIRAAKWFQIRILTSFFVGILTFVALRILRVDYSFSLGILAALTNLIPIVGPLFAGFVIAIFAFLNSPLSGLFAILIFILLQQIEGNIILPIYGKEILNLPPAICLLALLVGGKLGGFFGAILALPLFALFFEFSKIILREENE